MELREYQVQIAKQAFAKLQKLGIVYLALEMRVGKTLIALLAAYYMKARRVLFITKKKAISSIRADYQAFEFGFALTVVNYEQVPNLERTDFDLIIVDEAHNLGAFPKPAQRTQNIRGIVGSNPLILLSGTPSPESYSQLYHQFWISDRSPFAEYKNFYRWAGNAEAPNYVSVQKKMIGGMWHNDYKHAHARRIWADVADYFITYTQQEAGFSQEITENIRTVEISVRTKQLIKTLIDDRVVTLPNGDLVIADTPVKLQSKVHQMSSGTVIGESGQALQLDDSKLRYIAEAYQGMKIAVFYKYTAEGEALKRAFTTTESPEAFNASDGLMFISQVRSGAMGVNLSTADVIVFYNIDFSSQLYWQARARMQSKDRKKESVVDWIFSEGGIEEKIYAAVIEKKDYTKSYFERDFCRGKRHTEKDHRLSESRGSLRGQSLSGQSLRCT